MTPPEVSVVIPTRNRWPLLLAAALPSALAQRDVELEVVVVDDASSDETAERVSAVGDERVRLVRRDSRGGLAGARNSGIAAARGAWVAFLDDDDLWSPAKLRVQLDRAAAEEADFVYAAALVLDDRRVPVEQLPAPDPDGLARLLRTRYSIPAGASNIVVRRDLVRRLGGFDEDLFHFADWDLWLRLADAGRAAASPEVLVGYVKHAESTLLRAPEDVRAELDLFLAKHGASGVRLDRGRFSRWVAFEHRRVGSRGRAAAMLLRAAVLSRRPLEAVEALGWLLRRPRHAPRRGDLPAPEWLGT